MQEAVARACKCRRFLQGEALLRLGGPRYIVSIIVAAVVGTWVAMSLSMGWNLEDHKAFAAHVNKCVYSSYARSTGGYRKSGRKYDNVSHVFQGRSSKLGLKGFLNYDLPSDKATDHGYNKYYDILLQPYVNQPGLNVLEVGVKMGGSLILWRELFPPDAHIYGLDLDLGVPQFESDAHIKVLAGMSSTDQSAAEALRGIQFDIIVDDGAHLARLQTMTLSNLWPLLKPDGIYIIEDVDNDCVLLRQMHKFAIGSLGGDYAINADRSLQQVAEQVQRIPMPEGKIWITSHQDKTGQRLFFAYPFQSRARSHMPSEIRCAFGGAPGPACEEVMVPCGPKDLRSP